MRTMGTTSPETPAPSSSPDSSPTVTDPRRQDRRYPRRSTWPASRQRCPSISEKPEATQITVKPPKVVTAECRHGQGPGRQVSSRNDVPAGPVRDRAGDPLRGRGLTVHALRSSSDRPATPRPPCRPPPRRRAALTELRNLDYSRTEQGQLAWADEFDGDVVDTRRWTVRDRTTLSFDQAAIRARNVAVRDGALTIEARRESCGGRDYTTGYLDTIGQFSQRHGRWEIRARLPVTAGSSRGLWPRILAACR